MGKKRCNRLYRTITRCWCKWPEPLAPQRGKRPLGKVQGQKTSQKTLNQKRVGGLNYDLYSSKNWDWKLPIFFTYGSINHQEQDPHDTHKCLAQAFDRGAVESQEDEIQDGWVGCWWEKNGSQMDWVKLKYLNSSIHIKRHLKDFVFWSTEFYKIHWSFFLNTTTRVLYWRDQSQPRSAGRFFGRTSDERPPIWVCLAKKSQQQFGIAKGMQKLQINVQFMSNPGIGCETLQVYGWRSSWIWRGRNKFTGNKKRGCLSLTILHHPVGISHRGSVLSQLPNSPCHPAQLMSTLGRDVSETRVFEWAIRDA